VICARQPEGIVNSAPQTGVDTVDVSDDGAILMFVLLLMIFIGLGSVPVFDAYAANQDTTVVIQAANTGFYAADAGMEYAVQDLRASNNDCGGQSVTVPSTIYPLKSTVPIYFAATCASTSSVLTATISSWGGGGGEKKVTVNAVIAINISTRIASVLSWSSVQS
jgi:Tfp pilus assembly protein PilX